jgi:hypothetical protein
MRNVHHNATRFGISLGVFLTLLFSGCGGGGGGGGGGIPTYSISGTVSGAVLQGVTIALSGSASATTTTDASGNYSFTGLANGSYMVTPSLTGYIFSPTTISVTVSSANSTGNNFTTTTNAWIWVSGANIVNQVGVYGTKGTAAASNVPGARNFSTSWIDMSGNLWLFGGSGYDSAGTAGRLNDLWKFDGTNWTWMSGANVVNQSGVYGTKGTAAASNVPGARDSSVSWLDSSGNLWLFGGLGYDSAGRRAVLTISGSSTARTGRG